MDFSLLALFITVRVFNNTAIRMVYSFSETIRTGLGIDLALFSQAVALRYVAAALGPFLSSIADRRGRKSGMLAGLGLFTLGSAIMAAWPSFPGFAACLALNLLGNILFIPAMQAFIGDRIPYERRGLVLALTELSWSLSFILGVPAAGLLINHAGWLALFPVSALLGVLAWVLIAWRVPADPGGSSRTSGSPRANTLRLMLQTAPAVTGLLMGALFSSANELVNIVFNPWLKESLGVQLGGMAISAAVIGFSELAGEGLAAGLTDRMGKTRAVRAGLVLNIGAALLLPFLNRSLPSALAGLFLLYLTFEFSLVSCIPLMSEIMPQARATLMAGFITSLALGRAFGDLIGPVLYGWGFAGVALSTAAFDLAALGLLAILQRQLRARDLLI